MNAAIAQHLNVAQEAILEVQEWARVLWVRVQGLGARFVSKKVAQVKESFDEMMERLEREADERAAQADAVVAQISDRLPGSCASYEKLHSAACEVLRGEATIDEVVARFSSKKIIKRVR